MKVLILEDDRIIAQDIEEITRSMGYEICLAFNYQQALDSFHEFKPDLILSDINLNEQKTGLDFVNVVREKRSRVEIIFLTAHNDNITLENASNSSPLNFLVKPYTENQLQTSLSMAANFIAKVNTKDLEKIDLLSHKELKVLQLIATNKTSKDIAEELFVSDKTIRNHRYNISKKLGLSGENNSLLSWAVKNMS